MFLDLTSGKCMPRFGAQGPNVCRMKSSQTARERSTELACCHPVLRSEISLVPKCRAS
jgi:hypothetical protein